MIYIGSSRSAEKTNVIERGVARDRYDNTTTSSGLYASRSRGTITRVMSPRQLTLKNKILRFVERNEYFKRFVSRVYDVTGVYYCSAKLIVFCFQICWVSKRVVYRTSKGWTLKYTLFNILPDVCFVKITLDLRSNFDESNNLRFRTIPKKFFELPIFSIYLIFNTLDSRFSWFLFDFYLMVYIHIIRSRLLAGLLI